LAPKHSTPSWTKSWRQREQKVGAAREKGKGAGAVKEEEAGVAKEQGPGAEVEEVVSLPAIHWRKTYQAR